MSSRRSEATKRVKATAQFAVRLPDGNRRAVRGVVFDCPADEYALLKTAGLVVDTDEEPTALDAWPEPPDPFKVTEVDRRGRPVAK